MKKTIITFVAGLLIIGISGTANASGPTEEMVAPTPTPTASAVPAPTEPPVNHQDKYPDLTMPCLEQCWSFKYYESAKYMDNFYYPLCKDDPDVSCYTPSGEEHPQSTYPSGQYPEGWYDARYDANGKPNAYRRQELARSGYGSQLVDQPQLVSNAEPVPTTLQVSTTEQQPKPELTPEQKALVADYMNGDTLVAGDQQSPNNAQTWAYIALVVSLIGAAGSIYFLRKLMHK